MGPRLLSKGKTPTQTLQMSYTERLCGNYRSLPNDNKISDNKIAKFPIFFVMEFPRKNSVLGPFSGNYPPPQPLQNANLIIIVVSASLKLMFVSLYSSHVIYRAPRNDTWKADCFCVMDGPAIVIEKFWGALLSPSVNKTYVARPSPLHKNIPNE